MIATALREKGQVTLPQEIREAAGLETGDQVEWSVREGEIRGRKLMAQPERKRIYGKLVKQGQWLGLELPKGFRLQEDAIEKAVQDERENPDAILTRNTKDFAAVSRTKVEWP